MNKWNVHVENFGKIKKADIEVAPLTNVSNPAKIRYQMYRNHEDEEKILIWSVPL